jgi:hypothetical protein
VIVTLLFRVLVVIGGRGVGALDFLEPVSRRTINEVTGISRVAYDISGKPPATIEWEWPAPAGNV